VNLRLRDAAEADIGDAHAWSRERGHDLGDQFLQALDQGFESIQRNPHAYPMVHGDIRRALVRKFPYGIFYIVSESDVVVLGCLHGQRDPKAWRSRRDALERAHHEASSRSW
jgi:plasmid stabilization system protein ParE